MYSTYAKNYDSQFILKYCVENTLKPYTIYNGTKLMLLEIPSINLKIIDSSNFVQGPLSDFPKTFGLIELKKGYFPHLFNTKENENYVGSIPDKKYCRYNQMKPEGRKKFLEWYLHKVQENYIFDMEKEIVEYCSSDVDILRKGSLQLREDFNIKRALNGSEQLICGAKVDGFDEKTNTVGISISWMLLARMSKMFQ